MDLELSEDESSVALAFGQALARESSIGRVRAAEAAGFDPALWKVLAGMGAVAMALPETEGGGGGGLVSLVLAAEAAGRHLACAPVVEAAAAALVLAAAAAPQAAIAEACGDGPPVVFAGRRAQDDMAVMVPGGSVAAGVVALDGDDLVLVRGAPGDPVGDLGFLAAAAGHCRVTSNAGCWRPATGPGTCGTWVSAGGGSVRPPPVRAWRTRRWRSRPATRGPGTSSARRSERSRPSSNCSSIRSWRRKGPCLLAREAAWHYDHGLTSWRAAADMAYAHAAETAVRAAEACLHVHGGYGYTLEYDAQLYLRRAKALVLLGGDPEVIWARIGAATMESGR